MLFRAKMMASRNDGRVCRLCREIVAGNRAVSLFSTTGIQQQSARKIEVLLRVESNMTHL